MTRPEIAGLIERLERAAEGSRELDLAVAMATGGSLASGEGTFAYHGDKPAYEWSTGETPHYTTSLDAVLTLAGKNVIAVLLEAVAMSAAYFVKFSDDGGNIVRTLPRFACIAILKARA